MGVTLKKYIWVLGLICTVIISYLLAKIATLFIEATFFPNALITAAPSKTASQSVAVGSVRDADLDTIINRNFFDSKESVFSNNTKVAHSNTSDGSNVSTKPKKPEIQKPKNDKAVPTTLDIQLMSTISVGNGRNPFSSCVVKAKRDLNTYTIKDKNPFAPNTKIIRILAKRVEFLNKDQLEYVELEDFVKAKKTRRKNNSPVKSKDRIAKRVTKTSDDAAPADVKREGDTFKIPRKEIDKALADINKLYTDIRAVPYYQDGKANGFKLLSVKRGSLFQKLGLRRGDILKTVNGRTLDIQSGLETFNTLKNESEFSLELERRGESKSFKYEII